MPKPVTHPYDSDPIVPPAPKRRRLYREELLELLGAAEAKLRDHALLQLMYELGLRSSEPGRIRMGWLDLPHGRIYIIRGKGSLRGWYDLCPSTRELLQAWIQGLHSPPESGLAAYLFPGQRQQGRPARGLTPAAVRKLFRKYAKQVGLDKDVSHPHVLKHSRVQHLLEEAHAHGVDPGRMVLTIAKLVGHKAAETTVRNYSAITSGERKLARQFTESILGYDWDDARDVEAEDDSWLDDDEGEFYDD